MRWTVTVSYVSAAGVLKVEDYEVERDSAQEAEEAAMREVLRQPGRTIVGVEVDADEG